MMPLAGTRGPSWEFTAPSVTIDKRTTGAI